MMGDNQQRPADFGSALPSEPAQLSEPTAPTTVYHLVSNAKQFPDTTVLMVGKMEFKMLVLVAQVKKLERTQAYVTYTLDDHSGECITARQWMEVEDENELTIPIGSYGYFFGRLRSTSHGIEINLLKCRNITDINSVTVHLLCVIRHYRDCKTQQEGNSMVCSQVKTVTSRQAKVNTVASQNSHAAGTSDINITQLAALCFQTIKILGQGQREGVNVSKLQMLSNGDKSALRTALNTLLDCGKVYATTDENHFQALEG